MKKFISNEDFDQVVQAGEPFFLLKHSSTCPISAAAYEEYEKFADEYAHTYYLVVQEARPLSNYVAEKFQIRHESPQAFFFKNGEVAWQASHWKITSDSLKSAAKE